MRKFLLIFALIFQFHLLGKENPALLLKGRMLNQLEFIKESFEVRYAPFLWKNQLGLWHLDCAYANAQAEIINSPNPTLSEYHSVLKKFFDSTCDYHVGIVFCRTEKATLPITIRSTGGRFFIASVHRSATRLALQVGDEVLSFNKQPTGDVALQLRREAVCMANRLQTDIALADLLLTCRKAEMGLTVPRGECLLEVRKNRSQKKEICRLQWDYVPESISDGVRRSVPHLHVPDVHMQAMESPRTDQVQPIASIDKQMAFVHYSAYAPKDELFSMGTRRSFLPILGRKLWESPETMGFYAYLFDMPNGGQPGKKVGYIRIPHFGGDALDVLEFSEIISRMEAKSSLLVIDLLNNPGGAVFYTYALLSKLSHKALVLPKHQQLITQQEVYATVRKLEVLEEIESDMEAKLILGDSLSGYPVTYELVQKMKDYCHAVLECWQKGEYFTPPMALAGIDCVEPDARIGYTKPIILLINELDFSAADIFAATLQDNGRAQLFGEPTAGAGGYIVKTHFPNQLGVNYFFFTGSLAIRHTGRPIENLGVSPDVNYQVKAVDYQKNFAEYKKNLLDLIEKKLKG